MLRFTGDDSDARRASHPHRGARVAGLAATGLLAGGLLVGCATTVDPMSAVDPSATTATAEPESSASASAEPAAGSGQSGTSDTAGGSDESAAVAVGADPLDPVEVGKRVVVEDGTTVWVTSVREVQVEGRGPGEIHGPGVAVTVRVKNGSTSPLDLNGTAVSASFGDLPASSSSASPFSPLQGQLKAGKTAEGTYVFMKPDGSNGQVRIEIQNTAWPQSVEVHQ